MSEPLVPPAALSSASKRRRFVIGVLAFLGATVLLGVGYYYWHVTRPPEAPRFSLNCTDPAVLQKIENSRQEVVKDPTSDKAWGRLGMVLFANGFFDESDACLRQAEQLAPSEPRWSYLRALWIMQKDPQAGLAHLQQTADKKSAPAFVHSRLAEALLENGRLDDAEGQYHQALSLFDNDPRALFGLGRVAFQRGNLEESLDYLERSAARAPTARVTHALLAEVYFRLGNSTAADRERKEAAELPGEQYWPDPFYDQATDLNFGMDAQIDEANRLLHEGRPDEAITRFGDVIKAYPESAKPRAALGHAFMQLGNLPRAERAFVQAVEINGDNVKNQCDLGLVYMQRNKFSEAAACYRKAAQLKPGDGLAHFYLAKCLVELKDPTAAIQELRTAVRCNPNFADGFRELGRMLAKTGSTSEARKALEQAVALAPDDETARKLLESLPK
ncbi:MAG: tetratricopeptide repeat protein [Gemmataceae bacterium]